MFKIKNLLRMCLLLALLVWLLTACGAGAIAFPIATAASSLRTIQTLEGYLNEGNVGQALDLFSDGAVVLEVHPGYSESDQTSGYYTLGGYYIPRAYFAVTGESLYKGQEQINVYLSNLVENKFQSSSSTYLENEPMVTWRCQSTNLMEFKADFQEGKIKTLIVTVS
jgi:hypothetical protein